MLYTTSLSSCLPEGVCAHSWIHTCLESHRSCHGDSLTQQMVRVSVSSALAWNSWLVHWNLISIEHALNPPLSSTKAHAFGPRSQPSTRTARRWAFEWKRPYCWTITSTLLMPFLSLMRVVMIQVPPFLKHQAPCTLPAYISRCAVRSDPIMRQCICLKALYDTLAPIHLCCSCCVRICRAVTFRWKL